MSNDDECEFGGTAGSKGGPRRGRKGADSDSSSSSDYSSEDEFVDCPCGLNDVENRFMIECPSCHMWQHGNCINIWDPLSPILESYVCVRCLKFETQAFRVRGRCELLGGL